jgi:alpha-galactosidase
MITAEIKYNNKSITCRLNKSTVADEFYVIFTLEETTLQNGTAYQRLKLDVHPKQDIVLNSIEIHIPTVLDARHSRVFCNGFQSWSESRAYGFDEIPDNLNGLAKRFLGFMGDYHIDFISRKKGVLHSWTYSYLTDSQSQQTQFIGSLNESTGFTCILYSLDNQRITVKKELDTLHLTHSFPALDVLLMSVNTPSVSEAFDAYWALQNLKKIETLPLVGLSNAIQNTTDLNGFKNLDILKKQDLVFDVYHIDNGWQTHIGDWLSVKSHLQNDWLNIPQSIHNQGIKVSLWLAPFVVEAKSFIFRKKKDWILRGANGKPLAIGYTPNGAEKLYTLDFYNKDVQDYLTGVFHTIFNKWGFDMVKLDYLYAVCILSRPHKTRGQIMHEALAFLRQLVGSKILIASGVPLGSAFGLVDYCQTTPNINPKWEQPILKFLKYRERSSTFNALKTALNRWQLNGQAFQSNLDIFIPHPNIKNLTETQQQTLIIIYTLLGNLQFLKDCIGKENAIEEKSLEKYKMMLSMKNVQVKNVLHHGNDFYTISYEVAGKFKTAYCNLSANTVNFNGLQIEKFQTVIF